MATALSVYQSQVVNCGHGKWEVELPISVLQQARLSDVERWYLRFERQLVMYRQVYSSRVDPAWTAVTGYYCAFFGAQTLLSLLGMGGRGFSGPPGSLRGLYSLGERSSSYSDRAILELRQVGRNSHKYVWDRLASVTGTLKSVPGNSQAALLCLDAIRQLIVGPPRLSDVRNDINYSIDRDLDEPARWRSAFDLCTSVSELERHLQTSMWSAAPQRFELISLVAASFTLALYTDYLEWGTARDLRPSLQRRREVRALGDDMALAPWF